MREGLVSHWMRMNVLCSVCGRVHQKPECVDVREQSVAHPDRIAELIAEWRSWDGRNPIGPMFGAGLVSAWKGCADQLEAATRDTVTIPWEELDDLVVAAKDAVEEAHGHGLLRNHRYGEETSETCTGVTCASVRAALAPIQEAMK